MRPKALLVLLSALVVTLAYVPASGADVEPALSSGDTVEFLVPTGTPIITGATGHVLHFIGQPVGTIPITGCAPVDDVYPIQTVVAVDPGSGTRAQLFDVIVVSQTAPVHAGTQLESLSSVTNCSSGGINYDVYSGTVR